MDLNDHRLSTRAESDGAPVIVLGEWRWWIRPEFSAKAKAGSVGFRIKRDSLPNTLSDAERADAIRRLMAEYIADYLVVDVEEVDTSGEPITTGGEEWKFTRENVVAFLADPQFADQAAQIEMLSHARSFFTEKAEEARKNG